MLNGIFTRWRTHSHNSVLTVEAFGEAEIIMIIL